MFIVDEMIKTWQNRKEMEEMISSDQLRLCMQYQLTYWLHEIL